MRKPVMAKPRTALTAFSLSRILPKLNLPRSAAATVPSRPRPSVGRPGKTVSAAQPSIPSREPPQSVPLASQSIGVASQPIPSATQRIPPPSQLLPLASQSIPSAAVVPAANVLPPIVLPPGDAACARCGHGESEHPVRYVCDKYPHPDPLQICGCEAEHLDEVCTVCGHKARWHKPRHRCRHDVCHCWAFEE